MGTIKKVENPKACTLQRWEPIESFRGADYQLVDLWLQIYPSPRSMCFADSFRVVEAYQKDGKWYHIQAGKELELDADYITHWMPCPEPPDQPEAKA